MRRDGLSRRQFIARGAAGLAAGVMGARTAQATVGPNEKVRLGVVGCGGMGSRHIAALAKNPNCTMVALCDVYKPRYMNACKAVGETTGVTPDGYQDYRYVLDRNDVDAIFVPTPDHWHPLITIHGCEAWKDVYVEKPACPTVAEGRAMVEAARRFGRVVQLGTQQRSMPIFQEAIDIVKSSALGQITSAGCWIGTNGWGEGYETRDVPEGLDWDLWLGPAPYEPFSPQRFSGFMGCHDYARGGQLTNWGVHLMDIVHWGIGKDRPLSVQSLGGSYRGGPGGDNYDDIECILEYEGCNVTWEQRPSDIRGGSGYGIRFQGEKGRLYVDRNRYVVEPADLGYGEKIGAPELSWANDDHHNNFFECVKTRKRPVAEIEQGVRSTTAVLLAGIALKTGRKMLWDGETEQFINDDEANRYLTRAYRYPWRF